MSDVMTRIFTSRFLTGDSVAYEGRVGKVIGYGVGDDYRNAVVVRPANKNAFGKSVCYAWPEEECSLCTVPAYDRNGEKIYAGDTVWIVDDPREHVVRCISPDGGTVYLEDSLMTFPGQLLSKDNPETIEAIERDAEKDCCEYFGSSGDCEGCRAESGDPCELQQKLDLLARQRKVLERISHE